MTESREELKHHYINYPSSTGKDEAVRSWSILSSFYLEKCISSYWCVGGQCRLTRPPNRRLLVSTDGGEMTSKEKETFGENVASSRCEGNVWCSVTWIFSSALVSSYGEKNLPSQHWETNCRKGGLIAWITLQMLSSSKAVRFGMLVQTADHLWQSTCREVTECTVSHWYK